MEISVDNLVREVNNISVIMTQDTRRGAGTKAKPAGGRGRVRGMGEIATRA